MQQYSSVLQSVQTAVNIADPMALGAPADEYTDEIADLTRRITDQGEPVSSTTVLAVFHDWFGTRIPTDSAETVAVLIRELVA